MTWEIIMNNRSGMLLLVISQIMIVLVIMTLSFIVVMRQDKQSSQRLIAHGQSRLMMHAALMYIQEGSRLGWSYDPDDPQTIQLAQQFGWASLTGAAHGWTDSRDGSLGPRGPRTFGKGAGEKGMPPPAWWPFSYDYIPYPEDNDLSPINLRSFPCPGSAMRAAMATPILTTHATDGRYNYNPIEPIDPNAAVWSLPRGTDFYPLAALDPQPQTDNWTAFAEGLATTNNQRGNATQAELPENQLQLRRHTVGKAWFRVYRELLGDHDADGTAMKYGPSYLEEVYGRSSGTYPDPNFVWPLDAVALYDPNYPQLKNWNVFIISCGSGGTRGFRWWNLPTQDPRRALEPVTASESGYFSSEVEFRRLRESEHIIWFRVHWSPMLGGYADKRLANSGVTSQRPLLGWRRWQFDNSVSRYEERGYFQYRGPNISSQGGNFQFIQRLPSEPPNW